MNTRSNLKIISVVLFLFLLPLTAFAQTKKSAGWKKIAVCNFTFLAPRTVKDLKSKEADSCGDEFEDKNLRISVLYGNYGESFSKQTSMTGFKEEATEIDGRKAQLVSYIENFRNAANKAAKSYVSGLFVSVVAFPDGKKTITSLVMTIESKTKNNSEISRKIFKTIKFQ